MLWQDILMMVGGFGFAIALYPAIRDKAAPPVSTSLVTGGILTTYVLALATLGLYLSASATALTAVMWYILLFQRMKR